MSKEETMIYFGFVLLFFFSSGSSSGSSGSSILFLSFFLYYENKNKLQIRFVVIMYTLCSWNECFSLTFVMGIKSP